MTPFSNHRFFKYQSRVMKEITSLLKKLALAGKPCILIGDPGVGLSFLVGLYFLTLKKSEVFKEQVHDANVYKEAILNLRNSQKRESKIYKAWNNFYNELKIGVLHVERATNFFGKIARIELFGYSKGIHSTFDEKQPGLLEYIRGSLLYFDEIGDMNKKVQSMLIHALGPPHEAHRVGEMHTYSTTHLFYIATSTDITHKTLNPALKDRFQTIVFIPNLDERDEDVRVCIRWFLLDELIGISHLRNIQSIIGFNLMDEKELLFEDAAMNEFVEEIAVMLEKDMISRSWNENFNSIRTLIESMVLASKDKKTKAGFINGMIAFYEGHCNHYSELKSSNYQSGILRKPYDNYQFGIEYDTIELLELISKNNIVKDPREEKMLADFLAALKGNSFMRRDLDRHYNDRRDIKKGSPTYSRNILKALIRAGIIKMINEGKATYYRLVETNSEQYKAFRKVTLLSIPHDYIEHSNRKNQIIEIVKITQEADCVFVTGNTGVGKTSFMANLANKLSENKMVFFYQMGKDGIPRFFWVVMQDLSMNRHISLKDHEGLSPEELYEVISEHLDNQFILKTAPFLFIDNAQGVIESDDKKWLIRILKEWKDIRFVLSGTEFDRELALLSGREFREYPLDDFRN